MAIEAYPVGADSGFSEESAINSERDRLISALGGRMSDFIVDPFTGGHFDESHSASSLDITIDTAGNGLAFMGGHLVQNDAAITLTLDASSTNEIFLVVADGETGNAGVVFTSDGTTPSGSHVMKIWEATTDSSGVTGTTDFRKYTPFTFGGSTPEENITGSKSGESNTIDTSTTGVKTVDVTFDNPFRDSIGQVFVQPETLDDQTVEFAWWKATAKTVDGFTIEARVSTAGGSGQTATFDWMATGK